jgi:anaerobic selenocysteine-containing dehydrogenase
VRLESAAGAVVVPVEVTDAIRAGVVSLPHGWGHDPDGIRLRVASERPGVSVNNVTSEQFLDTLSGNAAFNGLRVTLERREARGSLVTSAPASSKPNE